MPDRRRHRGRHPEDDRLFGPQQRQMLMAAVNDLSWLLSREYAQESSLKLVGDRYGLTARQRMAVLRASASDHACQRRAASRCSAGELQGQPLLIDGYNLLITLESALSQAVLLGSRDGCIRDLASLHGTYRTVEETRPGIVLAGEFLDGLSPQSVMWLLDAPVSNSGRVAGLIRDIAREFHWNWQAELVANPDPLLADSRTTVATSDSWILDRCQRWYNLAYDVIAQKLPGLEILWLRG